MSVKKHFGDFVVFTEKGVFVQTIYYDPDFVRTVVDKCVQFAMDYVIPEIVKRKVD